MEEHKNTENDCEVVESHNKKKVRFGISKKSLTSIKARILFVAIGVLVLLFGFALLSTQVVEFL